MKKSSFILVLVVFLSFLFLGVFFWWGSNLQPVDQADSGEIAFLVEKGDGLTKISRNLHEAGLIKDPQFFKIYALFLGNSKNIKPGSYNFSPSMTPKEMCQELVKGSVDQWVTVVEGLRAEQIGQLFFNKGYKISLSEWVNQIKDENLEGKLFPDSYLIPKEASQEKIIGILVKNFEKKVATGLSLDFQKSKLSLEEVVILASMVEREARHEEDRAMVAGILLNRINGSWPLQIDATVQYAVSSEQCRFAPKTNCDWWPKILTQSNLRINSPYNTYQNQGLPPSPICNPGLSAIRSVLNPQNSDYWFYISDKNGNMHYAKNSEKHAENVRNYLR